MIGLLEAIRQAWITNVDLIELIPEERVFLGPANPGTPTPCIGLVGYNFEPALRSSSTKYSRLGVDAVAEAEYPEDLEEIAHAMSTYLDQWESTHFQVMRSVGIRCEIARQEDSPRQTWIATITITFDVYRT